MTIVVPVGSYAALISYADLTEAAIPTLESYLEPAIDQLKEQDNMPEEQKREQDEDDLYKNDRLFVWCGWRQQATLLTAM